jgi:hypothetical protein
LRPEAQRRLDHTDLKACELELQAHPDYSPGKGTPPTFVCSCGRTFAYVVEESEGAGWERVDTIERGTK